MRVGWLVDNVPRVGGAELTQGEFREAAPEGVEVVDCPVGKIDPDCDRYVIHNAVTYPPQDFERLAAVPTFKYWNDVGPWHTRETRDWLDGHTSAICCSPLQAQEMGIEAYLIPPPIALDRFVEAADSVNGTRQGVVSVGSWENAGKAPRRATEWAVANNGGGVDFYGTGPFAPPGSKEVLYVDMPAVLARYKTFVFLPVALEPFGRLVAEAWAAGCELVINELIGAKYWIEHNPAAIDSAAEDFWKLVLDD